MPAHLPIVLGLGLSAGVATLIYLNRDKIKEFVEQKRRELENELHSIHDEFQRTFNPETDFELNNRFNPSSDSSSVTSLSNPFSDSNRINYSTTNVSESEDEDELYHSYDKSQTLRNRSNQAQHQFEDSFHSEGSQGSGFFSFVDVQDVKDEDGVDSSTDGGVQTPTVSEAGDYIQAKAFA